MKNSPLSESDHPSAYVSFKKNPDTQARLDMAQSRIDALNDDYHYLSYDKNPGSKSHPYEGAVLFNIDSRPLDRASAIVHANSYDLKNNSRLDFNKENIVNRRIILSQTALGAALNEREPQFMSSYMNKDQMVWAHPLFVEGEKTAAVQLAFTINQNPDWNYPGNDDVEKIFKEHQEPLNEVARALADLALKTSSLSKSLEIRPPVTPNAFIVSWDVVNSSLDVLNGRYATHEAYLEAWKAEREKITEAYGVTILDRGDGEHIILPMPVNPNNPTAVKAFGERAIEPLIQKLQDRHAIVAKSFRPAIFPRISLRVGVGNFEEDQNNILTSQAITETVKLSRFEPDSIVAYTKTARNILINK